MRTNEVVFQGLFALLHAMAVAYHVRRMRREVFRLEDEQ